MERLKQLGKQLLFPHLAVVLVIVPAAAVLLIDTFLYANDNSPVAYVSYGLSTYALIVVCARLTRFPRKDIMERIHQNPYVHRYLTDVPFKTHVSLYLSLWLNMLFAAMKFFFGIWYDSVWFGTLAVYYTLLAVMRFLLLRHVNRNRIGTELLAEWENYRVCGVILLLINSALAGVVILVVRENESFQYDGYLIYVVALYAFYSVISAVMDVAKYRRYQSPVMSAAKAIKLATALVSMLSLETAMLMQFNSREDAETFRQVMTGATGGGVCAIVLTVAVFMMARSTKQIRRLKGLE